MMIFSTLPLSLRLLFGACAMEEELLRTIESRCNEVEEKIRRIENIKNDIYDDSEELRKLADENSRLEYRLKILKRAVANCAGSESTMQKLKALVGQAIGSAFPNLTGQTVLIAEVTNEKFGDYQINNAMAIGKALKANPRSVAEQIVNNCPSDDMIKKLEIAGPGFINVHLNDAYLFKKVIETFLHGVKPPAFEKRRVVIDFSSPNIAKEMHVGHLRSTIIGDSIARLLEFLGFDVLRLNHIGDWGTQFGMLIVHLKDQFPNYDKEAPPLADLQSFYKESKVLFDNDEKFKQRALDAVVKLQSYDPDHLRAWKLICDASRKDFQRIYDRLDVKITERGESFYQDKMAEIVRSLEEMNMVEVDEGRKIVFPPGKKVPLTVEKSGGGYTYDTSDLAALKHRLIEEKGDWLIYVVDAGQALHFQQIFAVGKSMSLYDDTKKVCHVSFGLVLGEDKKKFRTRAGETVKLTDLLDEGLKRAKAKLEEKERHTFMTADELEAAQKAVAYGCIKYADLSHNRTNDYIFSFDKMLDDKGNTAAYLLYTYVRIRSIARNAGVSREQLRKAAAEESIRYDHPKELKLAKAIVRFPDVLLLVVDTMLPNFICEYLYSLATKFSEFYENCYCIEKDKSGNTVVNKNRLILCEVTADVIAAGFGILGIKTIEKM